MMHNPLVQAREGMRRESFDRLAEHALAALPGPFLPWSRFAMRPGGVLTVLNDIWLSGRERVVECGGGISTVYTGRLLRQRGIGTLTTVEHDAQWATRLIAQVAQEGLEDVVTVVHAPLSESTGWYDASLIPVTTDVDLLVVDGPPAHHAPTAQARYAALPHFFPSLVTGATVILDDILRPGEQAIARRWQQEFGLQFDFRPVHGAVAVGSKN